MSKYKVPVIRDYDDGRVQYEPSCVQEWRPGPYSQVTREGSGAYPAPHKYRDCPA